MSDITDDGESTRGVRLPEIIDRYVRAGLARLHLSIPAAVDKVHTSGANITGVDCKPLVQDFRRDETGALVLVSVPIVTNVPISTPGGGGFRCTLPLERGDLGHLTFFDRSIDRWLSGDGAEVDPEIYSRFNLADATFVPGLRTFGSPWESWPSDHATFGADGGKQTHWRTGGICHGDEPGDPVATRIDLRVLFKAITDATVTPTDGGASFKSSLIASLAAQGWIVDPGDTQCASSVVTVER